MRQQEPIPGQQGRSQPRPTPSKHDHPGTVVVAGATGAVGAPLVAALRRRGYTVSPIARSLGLDLTAGTGLLRVVDGADTVVDVSSITTSNGRESVSFFEQTTHRLLHAAERAGVGHYVILSIVGTDLIDSGYYQGKQAQEQIVRSAAVPHTILRATQFHEFAAQMLRRMRVGPATVLPMMLCQPVAAVEVADRLADLVMGGPLPPDGSSATTVEFAGPEQLTLSTMVRRWQRHVGDRHLLLPVPLPGRVGRLMRSGGLLPQPGVEQGSLTFDRWLRQQPHRRRHVPR